eukprot:gnl/MRDRNA2_/MRDRNA2_18728_c0_seq1.p1 gnl/MRDRNA2_/MRDRNA2_18728_c0~~gnl/MRDRNA2_/MRDRNA2_18728_c0_seq1.p1  ORF type:complete len:581 (-),score=119.14 gnl/MRDRNA2_/MRDRNA2_18728_c0_seq1:182-1924(-)
MPPRQLVKAATRSSVTSQDNSKNGAAKTRRPSSLVTSPDLDSRLGSPSLENSSTADSVVSSATEAHDAGKNEDQTVPDPASGFGEKSSSRLTEMSTFWSAPDKKGKKGQLSEKQVEQLIKENDELRSRVASLNDNLARFAILERRLEEKEKRVRELSEELETVEGELDECQKKLDLEVGKNQVGDDSSRHMAQKDEAIATRDNKIVELEAANADLRAQVQSMQSPKGSKALPRSQSGSAVPRWMLGTSDAAHQDGIVPLAQMSPSTGQKKRFFSNPFKSKRPETQGSCSNSDSASFPDTLGPFAIQDVDKIGSELSIEEINHHVDGHNFQTQVWTARKEAVFWQSSDGLAMLAECIQVWPVRGLLGPRQPLKTLTKNGLNQMNTPKMAESFTWSPPMTKDFKTGSEEAVNKLAQAGTPEVAFVLRGGFVFFDQQGAICGASTVAPAAQGTGMQFGKPLPWKSEWTAAIWDRFAPITIAVLKDKGACYYGWVRPDEAALQNHPGVPRLEHGGFVYLFHEDLLGTSDAMHQDCIFPLVRVSKNTGQRGSFEFVSDVWLKAPPSLKGFFGNAFSRRKKRLMTR